MKSRAIRHVLSLLPIAAALATGSAQAQNRDVRIYAFGAKSGVVRIFGLNSEAAMKAAAEQINKAGGVTLGDGSKGRLVIEYLDDRCNAEEGINALRRIAAQNDAFVAVGPTCSNVAEPAFGILQKKAGDASDSGLQFPIYTDVAAKGGLAGMSQWAFRNVPSESNMYKSLFEWIKATRPDVKTIWSSAAEPNSETFTPEPSPVRSRCIKACWMPISAFMPAVMSHTDTPMRPSDSTPWPGAPLMATRPLSACTSRS